MKTLTISAQAYRKHLLQSFTHIFAVGLDFIQFGVEVVKVLIDSGAAIDVYNVFEIDGVDKVYFKQSGTALAATDLFAAAMSSF